MTAITLGRVSPRRLGATYPPALPAEPQGEDAAADRGRSRLAYLVLLRAEIARFTQFAFRNLGGYRVSGLRPNDWLAPAGTRLRGFPDRTPLVADHNLTRLCCSDPHLTVGSR